MLEPTIPVRFNVRPATPSCNGVCRVEREEQGQNGHEHQLRIHRVNAMSYLPLQHFKSLILFPLPLRYMA